MTLGTCRECEAEVSTEVDSCPQCGVEEPVRRLPSGKAPHGGPWEDWVRWKLRSEEPQTVADLLTNYGVNDYELALEEVERLQSRSRPQQAGPGPVAQDAADAFEGCLLLGGGVSGLVQTVVLFLVLILLLYLFLILFL